jgi:sarcosine oxidase
VSQRVCVVGAGVFGAWCARFLALAGHRVTLLDAYGPANGRASSADHSRVIRAGYGPDAIYSRWALESLDAWRELATETGQPLIETTGALFMGAAGTEYLAQTVRTLTAIGVRHELIDVPTLARRYPQLSTHGLGPAVFEPSAGVLRARLAVRAVVDLTCRINGVEYRTERVSVDEHGPHPRVQLRDGHLVESDAYVFACGPWLRSVLPAAVGARLRVTRQEVLYFGVPPGDGRFGLAKLPVWIDFDAGLYGIPDFDGQGFKVGVDRHGPPLDPDTADRIVSADLVEETRTWMGRRFPALAAAPLVDARVCQYENTSSGDFIIDQHPTWSNVWIVGGGSGHGFKHGPAVGRYVADVIDGSRPLEPRFSLATKTVDARRAVY